MCEKLLKETRKEIPLGFFLQELEEFLRVSSRMLEVSLTECFK